MRKNMLINVVTSVLLALAVTSCATFSRTDETDDVDGVLKSLRAASKLSFVDIGRNESGAGIIEYPCVIKGSHAVQQVASLIADAQFAYDDDFTRFLRDGGAVDDIFFLRITVDDRLFFDIFTGNSIKTAGFRMYTAKKYDPLKEQVFAMDLNQLLTKIRQEPRTPARPHGSPAAGSPSGEP